MITNINSYYYELFAMHIETPIKKNFNYEKTEGNYHDNIMTNIRTYQFRNDRSG